MYRNSGTALDEDSLHFLYGSSEMAEAVRAVDWSSTELGALSHWPQSLRYALSFCLNATLPTVMFWGDKHRVFFNDAFRRTQRMSTFDFGRPAILFWGPTWDSMHQCVNEVKETGQGLQTLWHPPQTTIPSTAPAYFECSLSPLHGDSPRVESVFATVVDTTAAVINERRLTTLRELALQKNDGSDSEEEVCKAAVSILAGDGSDVSFAVMYLLDVGGRVALRAGASPGQEDHAVCPAVINIDPRRGPVAIRSVVRTGRALEVHDLGKMFGNAGLTNSGSAVSGSLKSDDTSVAQRAWVLPVTRAGDPQLLGFLIAAVSPQVNVNREYLDFLNLAAEHIGVALVAARAYEEQRQWAAALIDPEGTKAETDAAAERLADKTDWSEDDADGQRNLSAATITACDRFRAFFEQRAIFACILSVDGIILESTGLLAELDHLTHRRCGFTRESIFGKHFWDGPWWSPAASLREEIREGCAIAATGHTFRAEMSYYIADGTPRVADVIILPIKDDTGKVLYLAPTGMDITDRIQAEEDLRQRAEEVQILLETLPVGVFIAHDPMCRVITGNQAAQQLLRASKNLSKSAPADEVPQHFRVYRHGIEVPADDLPVQRAARGEHVRDEEVDDVFDDGTVIHTMISASPLHDSDGNIRGAVASVLDVTERKKTEQALKDSQQFLKASLDALQSHIAVLDEQGRIIELNAAWRRFSQENGFTDAGCGIGMNYLEVSESSTSESAEARRLVAGIREVLQGERERFHAEYSCHSPLEKRWFMMQATRFIAGGLVRVVVAHENITERKLAEETLKEADRHKNEFLATLAHELRNPLAPIRSGMQVLQTAQTDDPVIHSSCKMMDRQVTQLVRLVDDLMDVSRISQGKLHLQKNIVPLAAAISDAVQTSRPIIEERGHMLTVSVPDESLLVDADLTRLAQVFTNLLNNASKYTNRGGHIWLTVSANSHEAEVRVRDNGIGIAPERAPDLFKLFMQLGDPHSQSQGGLGIGLSLVRQIVELHGGTIEAHSEGLGHGSEFIVRLPLHLTGIQEVDSDDGRSSCEESPAKLSLRILIVDDNRDGADSQAMLLRLMGNEIWTAYDGLEGIQMAEQFRPDVILLDIGLPTVSGHDVCRCIREQCWGNDVIMIALTGWGLSDDRRKSQDAGFDHHLVKPVDSKALARLLASISQQQASPK